MTKKNFVSPEDIVTQMEHLKEEVKAISKAHDHLLEIYESLWKEHTRDHKEYDEYLNFFKKQEFENLDNKCEERLKCFQQYVNSVVRKYECRTEDHS